MKKNKKLIIKHNLENNKQVLDSFDTYVYKYEYEWMDGWMDMLDRMI